MMYMKNIFSPLVFLIFLTASLYSSKLPDLSPQDTVATLHQIMEAHVSCKKFDAPLIQRALEHYLEELDPSKSYLLEEEVAQWAHPEEALVEEIRLSFRKGRFLSFFRYSLSDGKGY